ncbi:MAG: minor capsid protein [Betaproteobacteria bacterium]|nr:minor capsid protein [Betaproteobacteria bacterium]
MNLLPLAERLEKEGVGIMAETIFINMIPADAPEGVLLRNKLRGTDIDYELPGYYRTAFQVIVRATTYTAGEALIQRVFDALAVTESQIGPMYFKFMRPKTKPVVYPLSKGSLLEFSADFAVAFTE